jgi:hypothetical protein
MLTQDERTDRIDIGVLSTSMSYGPCIGVKLGHALCGGAGAVVDLSRRNVHSHRSEDDDKE